MTRKNETYTTQTDRRLPLEIRLLTNNRERTHHRYVLVAWCTDHGTVGYSMTMGDGGTPHSLSTLQSKGVFPKKAVAGWQADVVDAVRAGLYEIEEIR